MKKLISALMVCFAIILGNSVWAGDEHAAEGVIKDIKASDNKLTISHGPIKTMGMDGMTMDFIVSDPGMLEVVEKGMLSALLLK